MFAEQPRTILSAPPDGSSAGVSLAGEPLSDEEHVLDGLAGFCLLPAALDPEGRLPAFPGSIAVRHGEVEEWLTETVADREAISEAALLAWSQEGAVETPAGEVVRDSLAGRGIFETACASSLLFAPVAAATFLWQPVRVFRSFYAFSSMDRGVGRAVSGLLSSLLSQAVVAHPFRAGLGAWLSSASGRLLRDLRRVPFPGAPEGAEAEQREIDLLEEVLWDVAESFTGRGAEVTTVADLLEEVKGVPSLHGWSDRDGGSALLVLALLTAAMELGGVCPRTTLRLLDGREDAFRSARSLAAGLLGAWYGRRGLEDTFEAELETAEDRLWQEQRLEVATHGALLMEVSGLLELPEPLHLIDSEVAG